MKWPQRGVYLFEESGEERTDSGAGLRVARVGTHALKENGRTVLWTRLSQLEGMRAAALATIAAQFSVSSSAGHSSRVTAMRSRLGVMATMHRRTSAQAKV